MASGVSMRALLEAGVHFGHQTRRWNPKMKPYIFQERNGIYIIDLSKTLAMLNERLRRRQADVARRPRHSVRRHEEAGAGRRQGRGRARRHVLRQPALAGRHAHQLRDDPEAHLASARARRDAPARHLRSASQERSRAADRRAREAREVPRRHQGHAPPAGRDLHRRPEERAHRRRRGAEAEDPDHRGDRHELRSRRDRLRDPRQRRRDPQRAADGLDDRQRDHRRQDRDASPPTTRPTTTSSTPTSPPSPSRPASKPERKTDVETTAYKPTADEIKRLREETRRRHVRRAATRSSGPNGDLERAKARLAELGPVQGGEEGRTHRERRSRRLVHPRRRQNRRARRDQLRDRLRRAQRTLQRARARRRDARRGDVAAVPRPRVGPGRRARRA